MSVQAIWNGVVLAESSETRMVEGNHYFPAEAINWEYFRESSHHSICPWKGLASYYDVVVDGKENRIAAWYYPDPKQAAQQIAGYVAFWNGVKVQRVRDESELEEPENGVKSLIGTLFGA
jgi:uncharacterized protein (DUF427 family)